MNEDNRQRALDESFMDLALAEARSAEGRGEVPVGAVIARDGALVAAAANAPVSSNDPTAHAEILALRAAAAASANYRLTGSTLYVTLEPCAMCAGAMIHARIERLVFACDDPKAGAAGSLYDIARDGRQNHRIEVVSGIRADEASRLLQDFFRSRRA